MCTGYLLQRPYTVQVITEFCCIPKEPASRIVEIVASKRIGLDRDVRLREKASLEKTAF